MARTVAFAIVLAGCESEARVAADMERALTDSNTGLLAALFASELLVHVDDPPTTGTTLRHSTSGCGCPCVSRVGESLPYVVTLDYASLGCIPDSGLLPTALAGHAVLVVGDSGACEQTTFTDFEFALAHAVGGAFTGRASGDAADQAIAADADLDFGDLSLAVDLDVRVVEDAVTIDGTTEVRPPPADQDPRAVRFDGVHLPLSAIGAPCPRPDAGTATLVDPEGDDDTSVHFEDPGDGFVKVHRKDRISEPTDFCAYTSPLW